MTKTILKKYWLTSISACCITAGIALACAGDWGPEYGTSNFSPYVAAIDTSYHPFFFSNNFYYGINHDDGHDARFNNANTREWAGYFGSRVPPQELDFLLQHAAINTIDSVAAWANSPTSPLPSSMKGGKLTALRSDPKVKAFLAYLPVAKSAEKYALNNYATTWDYNRQEKKKLSFQSDKFMDLCLKRMANTDAFVKQRYLFQLIRCSFFNGDPHQTIDLFTQHEKEFTPGTIYYRSMAYAAGALYKLKLYGKANYLYGRVFAGCPELRTVAHYSFHPQNEADWRTTLALCQNKEEQATLWQMLGIFYSDEQRSIREIYQLAPGSDKLDLLLVRCINLYEQTFNDNFSGYAKELPDSSRATLPALVNRIAKEGRTAHPWLWNMAAGYISTLDKNYVAAGAWYEKTAKLMPKDTLTQWQLRLLKFINKVSATRKMDDHAEKDLLPDLLWLSDKTNKEVFGDLRTDDAFGYACKRIAALYSQQKDSVKAQCFLSTVRFYINDKQAAAMKAFLAKPSRTPFEELCVRLSPIKASDISEYQAIKCSYEGRLEEAIALMAGVPGASTTLLGNPFNARIQDCHDCDHAAPQKVKYNKLSFLQKMKELKDKIAAGTDTYTNSILLGNAYYNMSDYGNARVFYECSIIASGMDMDSVYHPMLFSNALSIKYYTNALNVATTDEQKAKCQYLLAKCQRNEWYNTLTDEGPHTADFLAWKGFIALRQYSSTQYYKDVLRECGYFKTYITQHP